MPAGLSPPGVNTEEPPVMAAPPLLVTVFSVATTADEDLECGAVVLQRYMRGFLGRRRAQERWHERRQAYLCRGHQSVLNVDELSGARAR